MADAPTKRSNTLNDAGVLVTDDEVIIGRGGGFWRSGLQNLADILISGFYSTGVGTTATSATNQALVAAGPVTLAIEANRGFTVGTRIRAAVTANPTTKYMEGVVTDYTDTALAFTADYKVGAGSYAAWSIGIVGDRGLGDVVGPAGATDGRVVTFDGVTGKLVKDSGTLLTALAVLASPAFTGNPTAPTQSQVDNSTKLASTGYVRAAVDAVLNGVSASFDTLAEIATELALKATLASPTFTGTPAAPTAAPGTNTTQVATTAFVAAAGSTDSFRDRVINGRFQISQRKAFAETTITDNAYWADRWRYIGEASAACTARANNITNSRFNGKVKFTGTTDKGGVFQIIRGANCKDLRGQNVVLSAALAVSNTRLGNIRMGIVEWTGTEDATTGDPVSAWNADGTNPSLNAGWAFLNAPANLNVTTGDVTYSVTATIGASANNLAMMIWNDDKVYNANDALYITDVQFTKGTAVTAFERRDDEEEMTRCLPYAQSSFPVGTAWAQNAGTPGTMNYIVLVTGTATGYSLMIIFAIRMIASPTITTYNPSAANDKWRNAIAATDSAAGNSGSVGASSFRLANFQVAGDTATQTCIIHWSAEAEL